jgi:CheY-like chemotaxis protein
MAETILLVEDNEDDALLIQRAFRRIGSVHPIRRLADGEQALSWS